MCKKKKWILKEKEADIRLLDQGKSEEAKSAEGSTSRGSSAASDAASRSSGSNSGEGTSRGAAHEELREVYNLYRMEVRKEDPIFITPKINVKKTQMEVDSGAALTVWVNSLYLNIFCMVLPHLCTYIFNILQLDSLVKFSIEVIMH